jgi:hypothetical protein
MTSDKASGRPQARPRAAATSAALRGASDSLLAALDELHRLEILKREEQPGSDRFVEIARQIRDLATEVLIASNSQEHLAEAAAAVVDARPDVADRLSPIARTGPSREVHLVLAEWRDAERRLAAAEPGSDDAVRAEDDVRRLRLEYRTAHEAALHSRGDT